MLQRRQVPVLRYLREFVRGRREQDGTDSQLLRRFAVHRDAAAFAELVNRHGPLVWGVCRRQLPQFADAEDAFQATFLVLVRKAGTIRRPKRLGNWLYGVACRIAAKARVAAATRAAREQVAAREPAVEPVDEVLWRDVRTLLDEEVQRLPDRYRAAFVLCYLEGLTNQEAARRLGCPEGTIVSRLAWARRRLHSRLVQRGLTLSLVALESVLLQSNAVAVPVHLVARMTQLPVTGTISASVAALVREVLQSMWWTRATTGLVICLTVAAVGTGMFAYLARAQDARAPASDQAVAAAPNDQPAPGATADAGQKEARTLAALAREVYEGALQRSLQEPQFAHFDCDKFSLWSKRWAEAERDARGDLAAKTAALQGHVDRMKSLEQRARDMVKAAALPPYRVAEAEYCRREAEKWFAVQTTNR